MKMLRKPTYSGKASEKDAQDIMFWAFKKSPFERVQEAWRLHCMNNDLDIGVRLNKKKSKASKRNK